MPRPPATTTAAPSVVIVDADRRVQASLADLLGVAGEVRVAGVAGDVRAALECVERVRPDAVLVDPRLPDVEAGMALVGGLQRAWPGVRIVLTGWGDVTGHGIGPGADLAYVSKTASPEAFAEAIVDACCPSGTRP
ncbi:MAG TPA: response regulator [Candidatus Angelobacter sp.]|nr:response regulator [Candidatus Angelobacter sp.]